ncbi:MULTISPECIES: hypothetical protein [Clostridium]|uniref:Uncharacterized protein n=1 Tax=Clostridium aquiflavi TaxID=3073603 RepID=A0ABU1EGJ6_9CLOT|nr:MULTISPECIES: hypothetical protein [unclassified Clostridium]MDR5587079.1 hypothetical protein [Clostridium sp. 5N-1]NFG61283.1 hypothetical protein [Clostridium botulinum]NFQ09246.1 hypothetical protein [Clostridium botulinum]
MEFKIKPPHKFKLRNIMLSLIFILAYSISTYVTLQKPIIIIDQSFINNKIKNLFISKNENISSNDNTENYKDNGVNSEKNNGTYEQNVESYSDNFTFSKNDCTPTDYSKLTINQYVSTCVTETFGKKDNPYLSRILFSNNSYTIYINIGFYRNSDELKAAAINASVELYKSLYTLYPEKFGHTLFGIVVSGDTINKKGDTTHIDEAAVSWYNEKTLEALDINNLTVNNFKDTVYRFYDYQNQRGIQRD